MITYGFQEKFSTCVVKFFNEGDVSDMSMDEADKQGFFADRTSLDMEKYLIFDYYFESMIDPEEAAAHLCQE